MKTAPLRILLIDDNQLFRNGLRLLLERAPGLVVVGEAGDGPTALTLAQTTRPDVIVADIRLPDGDGIELAARILAKTPATKVIFLSAEANLGLVRRALDAGGSGYLLKDSAPNDLVRAIEAVKKNGIYLGPELMSMLAGENWEGSGGALAARPKPLSAREAEVLRFIAEGLRNKEIAGRLKVSIKSVETYRKRLLTKLGYDSTAELVRHAIREGFVAP
jgi:DNA-binding NarL/FixJ family response regulator